MKATDQSVTTADGHLTALHARVTAMDGKVTRPDEGVKGLQNQLTALHGTLTFLLAPRIGLVVYFTRAAQRLTEAHVPVDGFRASRVDLQAQWTRFGAFRTVFGVPGFCLLFAGTGVQGLWTALQCAVTRLQWPVTRLQ